MEFRPPSGCFRGWNSDTSKMPGGLARRRWGRVVATHACVIATQLLCGCAVGPTFQTPPPPAVTSLSPAPLASAGKGRPEQQAFVHGLDIPRRWWELLHCDALNSLVIRAIERNPDLAAAQAALRIADANMQAARGGYFPQVGANIATSAQTPNAAQTQPAGRSTSPYTIATGQLSVSFVLDVFGLNRRRVESLAAQAEAQQFEVEAAYLTLTSKLALAAIEEASLRDEMRSAKAGIAVASEVLLVLRKQLAVNEATRVDVSAQEVTLSQFQQAAQSLRKRLAVNRDLMSALAGGFAGDGLKEKFEFACLRLPAALPLSLPASIVRRRPDVRAAEAMMHAATADIGVAVASRFPEFNLSANVGTSAIAKLAGASPPFLFWTIAGSAAQTLFDGMSGSKSSARPRPGSIALRRSIVAPSSRRSGMSPTYFRPSRPTDSRLSRRIAGPRQQRSISI